MALCLKHGCVAWSQRLHARTWTEPASMHVCACHGCRPSLSVMKKRNCAVILSKKVFSWILSIFIICCGSFNFFLQPVMASDKPENRAGPVMLMDQSGSAYGGILKDFSPSLNINDSDVAKVIKFAVQHIEENYPAAVPKDPGGKSTEPLVSDLKKLILQGTKDGKAQHYLVESTFVSVKKQQFQRRKAIYGLTYSFGLTWSNAASPLRHNMVVSLDRERNMFLFEHTFSTDSSPASESESDLSATSTKELPTGSQSECLQDSDSTAADQSQCRSGTQDLWSSKRRTEAEEIEDITQSSGQNLSIITQNIWNFNGIYGSSISADNVGAYTQRVTRLGRLVADTKADIIGFQEVRFEVNKGGRLGPCQVQQLAKHLPQYQFVYQPAINYVPNSLDRSEEGLAIFSRYPILSHDYILLSRDMNDEEDQQHQRICLHAEIKTPSVGRVHIFVTHLSLSEAARERSVLEIWNHMNRFPGPAVLIGDLNAHPRSRIIRFLQGEQEIGGVKTEGLQDAWLLKNKEPRVGRGSYAKGEARDPGLTFSALNEHLSERIDYIFVRLPGDTKLADISLVDDGDRGPVAASDHLGLKATIARS
ncbi:uncharacterized protein LOC110983346 [Acanthaster planci]|uniref:Uncharacterized protein LOC110983346 n=1 Tax=Acanthaster planci TaxID=133434 RepID=A0A8B7YY14_ACAPL|nr:uncharacterized protein LOC110983346 [Acanthaster planci]